MQDNTFDTSEYRQALWEKEYAYRHNLPTTVTEHPSRALIKFLEDYEDVEKGHALDLGTGNARNAIFLAEQGFEKILGVEIARSAVENAQKAIKEKGLSDKIVLLHQSLNYPITALPNSISLAIDMMTMHALTERDRGIMADELRRLVKPGGYFVFHTIAADSPAAQDLMKKYPGPEENSYRFKVDGDVVTEKAFTRSEIEQLFDPFELLEFEPEESFTPAFGDVYKRVYYYGVMKKPS